MRDAASADSGARSCPVQTSRGRIICGRMGTAGALISRIKRTRSLRSDEVSSVQLSILILSFGHFITLITDRSSCHASIVVASFHHPTVWGKERSRREIDCHLFLATHSPLRHNKQPDDCLSPHELHYLHTHLINCRYFPFPVACLIVSSHILSRPQTGKGTWSAGKAFQPSAARQTSSKSGAGWTWLT